MTWIEKTLDMDGESSYYYFMDRQFQYKVYKEVV